MIGQTLSHYLITSELGRGGMGVVYRAHDQLLNRDVALKLMREDVVNQSERRGRILVEARAASALNHPGITTIYDVGETDEHLFIVMELVQGQTLRDCLSSTGPIEALALTRLGVQIAEALDAAHSHGVVHGDIKPENIVVQAAGAPKLFDFGIARQIAAETATLTRSVRDFGETPRATIAGTLAYMPPEILRGEPGDMRSDLYSLGAVLFEISAGQRPFVGPTITALVSQILHEPAPRLGDAQNIVPQELARIVQKLLEKYPGSHYQTARELKVDLANLQRDLELGALLPAAMLGKRSVAVLPFKLLTPNPEDEYLGVALADAVINHVGGSGEVLVRPINAVRRYAKQAVDPLLAAREMNVHIVVDGSIQKSGSRLRVHVQAWNAADGTTLLTGKYDSEIAALFELQDKSRKHLLAPLGLRHLVHLNRRLSLRRKTPEPTNYSCVRLSAYLASTNGTREPALKCWRTLRNSIPTLPKHGRGWQMRAYSWPELLTPYRSGIRKVNLRCGERWHWIPPMRRPIARTAAFSGRRSRDIRTARRCGLSGNLCGGVPAIILRSFGNASFFST